MELKVWIGSVPRVISGVSTTTTSQEVIIALAQATGKTGRFTLVQKWGDYEKTLSPNDCPLSESQKFGQYAHELKFILKQTGELSTNRRLIDAKSPKPTRRKNQIKKSHSFSGGAGTQPPPPPRPSAAVKPQEVILEDRDDSSQGSYHAAPSSRKPSRSQPHLTERTQQSPTPPPHPPRKHRASPLPKSTSAPTGLEFSNIQSSHSSYHTPRNNPSDESTMQQKQSRRDQMRNEQMNNEILELQAILEDHERKLKEEQRKLGTVDKDIAEINSNEEKRWEDLYGCKAEINKSITSLKKLDWELNQFDEYLLSEEINSLLIKQKELEIEREQLRQSLTVGDSKREEKTDIIEKSRQESLTISEETEKLKSNNSGLENEIQTIQSKLEEKKQFLVDAKSGFQSACDELSEANTVLDERQVMLADLERELRDYNLKNFISSGIEQNYKSRQSTKDIKPNFPDSRSAGLLV